MKPLSDREKDLIRAMADCDLNVSEAARALYYARSTIDVRLNSIAKKTGLDPRCFYNEVELLELIEDE